MTASRPRRVRRRMILPLQNVAPACFGLSYLLAWGLELARLRWPRPAYRLTGLAAGAAGLVAHSLFLAFRRPSPASAAGALVAVAWVLAVFYLYGTLHHPRRAWAVFVLPVVLGLVGLGVVADPSVGRGPDLGLPGWLAGGHVWGALHGLALVLAAVGVSVGFLASVMYLVQARRLRRKADPLGGVKMLSLERLEAMNRRAVAAALPLLTAGLLLGAVLVPGSADPAGGWLSVKVVGTVGLWAVVAVLCYLRYAAHVPGRRLARLTIAAFGLMVAVLAAAHPFVEASGGRESPDLSPHQGTHVPRSPGASE